MLVMFSMNVDLFKKKKNNFDIVLCVFYFIIHYSLYMLLYAFVVTLSTSAPVVKG